MKPFCEGDCSCCRPKQTEGNNLSLHYRSLIILHGVVFWFGTISVTSSLDGGAGMQQGGSLMLPGNRVKLALNNNNNNN